MDPRERWQALQARLTAARAAVDRGDRALALTEIASALELDAEFLAAHALRDRIVAMDEAASQPVPSSATHSPVATSHAAPSHPASTPAGAPAGYANFEQRAKRRRVDRRIDAARAAIGQQRLKAAASALDEVIELDPNLPELAELTARFDELRRAAATPRRGPWLAAAAVFLVAVFGGSWLQDAASVLPRQVLSAAPLPALLTPIVTVVERFDAVVTTEKRYPLTAPGAAPAAAAPAAAAPVEAPAFAAATLPAVDDTVMVTQALLGYRWTAEDASDAAAGFDSCDPRVQGDAATAVCHAGSGAWNVTLRKTGASWRVENARAER